MAITQGTDTFGTLAEAEAYFLIYSTASNRAAWAALATDAAKEIPLRNACMAMEAMYAGRFVGELYSESQALSFPRKGYDNQGRNIDGQYPTKLKYAQFELAVRDIAETDGLISDQERGGKTKREKVGPLEVEYMEGAPAGKSYLLVERLLRDLLVSGVKLVRC